MSKLRLLSIAVIGLLLVNVTLIGIFLLRKPQDFHHGRPPMANNGPKQLIIERLQFDPQQTKEYTRLIQSHQSSIRIWEDSIRLLKNKLYQTLKEESSTRKDSTLNQLVEIQKQIELSHYNHFADIKKLCKPDQIDKFDALASELAHFFARKNNVLPPPGN